MMHLLGFGSAEVGPRAANEFENKTGPRQGSNDRLGNWGVTRLRIWGSGVRNLFGRATKLAISITCYGAAN